MRVYDIILKKRNGEKLTREEIEYMIMGYVKGEIPDYQMSAFLMAIYFQHLDEEETYFFTETMMRSGETLDLSSIPGKKVDKHSTGGVGDKTTLVVAPLVASCGVTVAKMSGRALGHTGGTIDKLESIPGFRTSLSFEEFISNVKKHGIAVVGQTGELVPADKKIYALRDATATVDEVSLIASSIMSKKLAGGSDAFVLDVKFGSGAFMKSKEKAKELAKMMVNIGKLHGKRTVAILSSMDQPLGRMVGNSLEVIEAIEALKGKGPEDLTELSLCLASYMLYLAGVSDLKDAERILRSKIESGEALEKFREMIEAQGGDARIIEDHSLLPISKNVEEVLSDKEGFVEKMDTEKIGVASMVLGAGRKKKEDEIDHSVGVEVLKKLGDRVSKGEPLVKLYCSEKSDVETAKKLIKSAYSISEQPLEEEIKLIHEVIE
ncbi:MAG: pyrimidine-nucleoside phosphorylase [Thermotogae bacterium]|nr:MAG: pyrimidine-nucleoside phosphorylase [Thermotogota bacterium]